MGGRPPTTRATRSTSAAPPPRPEHAQVGEVDDGGLDRSDGGVEHVTGSTGGKQSTGDAARRPAVVERDGGTGSGNSVDAEVAVAGGDSVVHRDPRREEGGGVGVVG